jgi:hypothetical protein
MTMLDLTDKKWRFEERVANLIKKGRTREEAERIVQHVIETKEQSVDEFELGVDGRF